MNNYCESIKKNNEIIDVVEDFNYNTQTEKYNKAYKKWRKNKDNPFAFFFVKNINEKTFVEGKGFLSENPQTTEKTTISSLSMRIGIAFLIYLAIDKGFVYFAAMILNSFGVDVSVSYLSSEFAGNKWILLGVNMLASLLKFSIPLIVLIKSFRLPTVVISPIKLYDKYEFIGGLSIAIIVSVFAGLISSTSLSFLSSQDFISTSFMMYGKANIGACTVGYVFEAVIISILAEFLLHGVILHSLRQFGDIFAITVTTFLSFIMVSSFSHCIQYSLLTLLTGIFILRSGSIVTGIAIRVVVNLYFLGITLLNLGITGDSIRSKAYFAGIFLVIGTIGFILFVIKHTNMDKLVNNMTFITFKQKMYAFVFTPTLLLWITFAALFAILNFTL